MSQPIRVWRIPLLASDPLLERRWMLLSAEERQRAAQFRNESDRHRHVLSHGAMREILAHETGCAPAELRFISTSHGKPYLQAPFEHVQFNLSHSAELALLAVSHDCTVGADVEFRRPLDDLAGLIAQVCSPREAQLIATSANPEQLFYQCWVGKEAVLKCVGTGLNLSLREFDVLDVQGSLKSSLVLQQEREAQITLRRIDELPTQFMGAVAVASAVPGHDLQSPISHIQIQDWAP